MHRSTISHPVILLISVMAAASIFPFSLSAQFSSEKLIEGNELYSPDDILTADLDGDGDKDILAYSWLAGKIVWFENQGMGVYGNAQLISNEVIETKYAQVADMDGDGDLDIITGTTEFPNNELSLFENLGDGVFVEKLVLVEGSSFDLADLDADGDLDIIYEGTAISWLENLGGGSFASPQFLTEVQFSGFILGVTDLDDDADLDIIYFSDSSQGFVLQCYKNEGDNIFSSSEILVTEELQVKSMYLEDMDEDGLEDIVVAFYSSGGGLWWYPNSGQGVGEKELLIENVSFARDFVFGDIDDDDDKDVFFASDTDQVYWYENTGNQTFGSQQLLSEEIDPRAITLDDIDNDGDQDVVFMAWGKDKIAWLENEEGPGFLQHIITVSNASRVSAILAADLDDDGDPDVLSASHNDNKVAWYEYEGNTFSTQQIISVEADAINDIQVADLDNDGDLDVLSASSGDDGIAWYENMGDGTFGGQQLISDEVAGAWIIITTDIDADGNVDVLSASPGEHTLSWYRNMGGGTFGNAQIIANDVMGISNIAAADQDNDGDIDIVVTADDNRELLWYEHLSNGQFGAAQVLSSWSKYGSSIYLADMNMDGKVDILLAYMTFEGRVLSWYENLGEGNFSEEHRIDQEGFGLECPKVHAADLDNDGDPEIIETHAIFYNGKVNWYENYGNGTFSEQRIIDDGVRGGQDIFAADFNQDGYTDVLGASHIDSRIVWYENLGIMPTSTVDKLKSTPDLHIYPNPATKWLSFDFENIEDGRYQIELWDISGHLIKHFSVEVSSGYTPAYNLRDMAPMHYVVKVLDEAGSLMFTKKLVYVHE